MGSSVRLAVKALALLALALAVWGCGGKTVSQPSNNKPPALQAKDDLGRTVSLVKAPQRIVCLAPNVTEIAFALGLDEKIVGVSEFSDYPPQAQQKPSLGRYDRPSIEKIVSLHPDLALLGYGNPQELSAALERVGIVTFGVNPKNIHGIFDTIERIGIICGVGPKARQLADQLRKRLDGVNNKLVANPRSYRPKVFVLIDEGSLWTAGSNTLQDEVLRLAGGRNIAADRSSYYQMSREAVFAAQPDLILVAGKPSQAAEIRKKVRARNDLAALPAVKANRIAVIDGDIFSRPGPRVVDAVEQLFTVLNQYSK